MESKVSFCCFVFKQPSLILLIFPTRTCFHDLRGHLPVAATSALQSHIRLCFKEAPCCTSSSHCCLRHGSVRTQVPSPQKAMDALPCSCCSCPSRRRPAHCTHSASSACSQLLPPPCPAQACSRVRSLRQLK